MEKSTNATTPMSTRTRRFNHLRLRSMLRPGRLLDLVSPMFLLLSLIGLVLLGEAIHWGVVELQRSYRHDNPENAAYAKIPWEDLVPKDWDPLKRFKRNNALGESSDDSAAGVDLARRMRETWDNAPTNRGMDGARVKLLGYVVPLQANKGELKEFLLVPYFGACIHVPPPPANQIVHVTLVTPVEGIRTMDSVWVSGTLSTTRENSLMGVSAYAMHAIQVEKRPPRVW